MKSKERSLNSPVLMLNKSWVAVGTTTVKDALVAMSRGRARGLCTNSFQLYDWAEWIDSENPPETNYYINSSSGDIAAPEIIVSKYYNSVHMKSMLIGNRAVYRRDNYTCQYCGKKCNTDELSLDHIVPRCRGGKTSWTNVVTSCVPCNQRKADRSLAQMGWQLNPQPRKPKWSPIAHISKQARPESWSQLVKE